MGRLRRGRDRLLPKTVDNVLTVLSTLLKKAVEWGTEDALRLLDGRQSGLEPAHQSGHFGHGERVGRAMRSAFALKRYGETTSA